MGSTVNTSFPFRRDLTGPSCSGFNLNSLRATTLKSAKALASTSTPVASLVVFALLHITNRPIVRLAIQNFAATSDHRNQTMGVFIAGVPSPPPSLCFFFFRILFLLPHRLPFIRLLRRLGRLRIRTHLVNYITREVKHIRTGS